MLPMLELDRAGRRVREMDKVDGFRDRYLTTIKSALEAGLMNPGTGAEFDALYMLQDLIESGDAPKVRP